MKHISLWFHLLIFIRMAKIVVGSSSLTQPLLLVLYPLYSALKQFSWLLGNNDMLILITW
jgi:hypothetical protein